MLALVFRTRSRWMCCGAMVLSTIGDILLLRFDCINALLPIPPFYAGAGVFMLAHLVYTLAYRTQIRNNRFRVVNRGFRICAGLVALVGILVFSQSLVRGQAGLAMVLLCFVYLLLIGGNCCTVVSLAWSAKGWRSVAAIGAICFFLSDLIISADKLPGECPLRWRNWCGGSTPSDSFCF